MFGWDLPPGVTTRMIEEAMGEDEHGRYCKCDDCQNERADMAYEEARDDG